jgi:hypothetical protein
MGTHDPGCPPDPDGGGDGEGDADGEADGVGAGAGGAVLGAADVGLGGAGVRVDPGGGCRETGEPDCGRPPRVAGDVAGIAATGCTCQLPRERAGWAPGRREGRLVLLRWNGGWADEAGSCDLADVGSRMLATTTAVTPATAAPVHAAGRARMAVAARRAVSRRPASSAIPIGRPARHPARREARIASITAARCRLASMAFDT